MFNNEMHTDSIHDLDDLSDTYDWPIDIPLGKKLLAFEENFLCPICYSYYNNPHSLNCGHSFCSICIRKHLDKAINRTSSDICPICKSKAELYDLKKNMILSDVIKSFYDLRKDLYHLVTNQVKNDNENINDNQSNIICNNKIKDYMIITKRMPHYSFHNMSKDKTKKTIEQLLVNSKVKLRLDGDKEDLERRLRELVHLNNSQIDNTINPLTFEEVIIQVNNIEKNREISIKKASKATTKLDRIKSGEVIEDVENKFALLTKQIREHKEKEINKLKSNIIDDNFNGSNDNDKNVENDNINENIYVNEIKFKENKCLINKILNTNNITHNEIKTNSDKTIDNEYNWGPWRIIMSNKLYRPFFYHTITGIGQFEIPTELHMIIHDHNEIVEDSNKAIEDSNQQVEDSNNDFEDSYNSFIDNTHINIDTAEHTIISNIEYSLPLINNNIIDNQDVMEDTKNILDLSISPNTKCTSVIGCTIQPILLDDNDDDTINTFINNVKEIPEKSIQNVNNISVNSLNNIQYDENDIICITNCSDTIPLLQSKTNNVEIQLDITNHSNDNSDDNNSDYDDHQIDMIDNYTDNDINNIDSNNEDIQANWNCKVCTLINRYDTDTCEICGNLDKEQQSIISKYNINHINNNTTNITNSNGIITCNRGGNPNKVSYYNQELFNTMITNNRMIHSQNNMTTSHMKSKSNHKRTITSYSQPELKKKKRK